MEKMRDVKYSVAISAEQELLNSTGLFFKGRFKDGKTATLACTEIDISITTGINIKETVGKDLMILQALQGL